MHADLAASLVRLETDLRTAAIDRSALFWLKTFADLAAGGGGSVRSDRWVEDGLAATRDLPGLPAAELAPRQHLVSDYGLFRFMRLKDDAEFSGEALAELDWQRKYRVSLAPAYLADLSALQGWTDALWAELGGWTHKPSSWSKYLRGIWEPPPQLTLPEPPPRPSPWEEEGVQRSDSLLLPGGGPGRRFRRTATSSKSSTKRKPFTPAGCPGPP